MTKNLESMPAERIVMKQMAVKKVAMMVMTMRTIRTIPTCSQSLTVHLVKPHVDRNKNILESAFGTGILRGQIMRNYHANRDDVLPNNPEFGSKVVRITVCKSCPQQTAIDFTKALQEVRYAGLSYDFVDKTTKEEDYISDSQTASLRTPATNKICSAVCLIERVMNDLDYRLHNGEVYRKVPQAKFTFVRSSNLNDFVHALIAVQSDDARGDCT